MFLTHALRAMTISVIALGIFGCKTTETAPTTSQPQKQVASKTPAAGKSFEAPQLIPGTKYVFTRTKFGLDGGTFEMTYHRKVKGWYDLGGNKKWRGINRLFFPLTFGKTWEFTQPINRHGWCDDHKNKYNAKVGPGLEKVVINGKTYEVLRVTYKGTWTNHCAGNDLEGDIAREDLYSPELGMIVSTTLKIWNVGGDLAANTRLELASYTVPKRK